VGLYPDGRPGELFITMAKEGSTIGGLMDCFGTAISMSLQYGVPLEVLVNKFSHTRFDPMGHTTNPEIRIAKSVVDYIFRWMGMNFLNGYREASQGLPLKVQQRRADDGRRAPGTVEEERTKAAPAETYVPGNGRATGNGKFDLEMLERAGLAVHTEDGSGGTSIRSEQFARFQSDAPACDNCGAITVRNGNCYLCHNCGNSMGCS
jgi:ribonucleoside-diphosphate reductase alpha chain